MRRHAFRALSAVRWFSITSHTPIRRQASTGTRYSAMSWFRKRSPTGRRKRCLITSSSRAAVSLRSVPSSCLPAAQSNTCAAAGRHSVDRASAFPAQPVHQHRQVSGRFVEDDWLDGKLTIGDSVVLDDFASTLWCVGSTLAQEELPRDRSIRLPDEHQNPLGAYNKIASTRAGPFTAFTAASAPALPGTRPPQDCGQGQTGQTQHSPLKPTGRRSCPPRCPQERPLGCPGVKRRLP